MVTYKFKLVNSIVPVIKGRNVITDSNVGGTKNTYEIRIVYRMNLEFKVFGVPVVTPAYYSRKIGTRTFWRPYQSVWDKKKHRKPAPYWGKGPLLNMWLVLSNDYDRPQDVKVLMPEADTTSHTTEVCGIEFLSQELNNNLKSNSSFYQSKFEKS
jgi:hypothetical protein